LLPKILTLLKWGSQMLTISEYQEGTRNARVYRTQNGEYGVVVYDSYDDTEKFSTFVSLSTAEDYAEDWVTHNDPI